MWAHYTPRFAQISSKLRPPLLALIALALIDRGAKLRECARGIALNRGLRWTPAWRVIDCFIGSSHALCRL